MMVMVHDNLYAAADHLAAIAENDDAIRRASLRCVMELAEQCPPGASISTEGLASLLAMIIGD